MGNSKYTLQKNKNKIIAGLGIIIIMGGGFGLYTLLSNPKPVVQEEEYIDKGIRKADYIFLANNKGEIDLYSTKEDSIVNTLDIEGDKVLLSRDNDLETIMAYSNGVFYEVNENEGKMESKEIAKYSSKSEIKSFKFSNEYIVALTEEEAIIINLTKDSITSFKVKGIEKYTIADKSLVYSIGDYIYSKDLTSDKEPIKIEIGDKTEALLYANEKMVVFNNFGDKNNKTTILKVNPSDLYIEYADKHDNKYVYPLSIDSDDSDIKFIDFLDKDGGNLNSHYTMTLDKESNNAKNRISLPNEETENKYNEENTISTKGYFYSNKNSNLTIFDLRAEGIDKVVNTDKTFFMPILK